MVVGGQGQERIKMAVSSANAMLYHDYEYVKMLLTGHCKCPDGEHDKAAVASFDGGTRLSCA